jgi:hypothetical protein
MSVLNKIKIVLSVAGLVIVMAFLALIDVRAGDDWGGRLLAYLLHPNPFVDFRLYAGFCAATALLAVAAGLVLRRGWLRERDRVRDALLRFLELPPGEPSWVAARERVMALVPCTARHLAGPLEVLPAGQRLWLCFLPDWLLVIPGSGRDAVALPASQFRKLGLVERGADRGYALAVETESGGSVLDVPLLDDLVRVVNVLIKQGATLEYHAHAGLPIG